jgi:hypothetical protein
MFTSPSQPAWQGHSVTWFVLGFRRAIASTPEYNSYSYVANNATTWVDPSGHEVTRRDFTAGMVATTALIMARPLIMGTVATLCAALAGEAALAAGATAGAAGGPATMMAVPVPVAGNVLSMCVVTVTGLVTGGVLACALIPECRDPAFERAKIIAAQTSPFGSVSDTPTFEQLKK